MQPRLHRSAARAQVARQVAALTLLTLLACKGREAACRERCLPYGLEPAGEHCTVICTQPCTELQKYGVGEALCRHLQTGAPLAAH